MKKLLYLIQFLLLSEIKNIYCDTERIIHLGNIPEIIQDNISNAIDKDYENSEKTDNFYIIIQNHIKKSNKSYADIIYSLLESYSSFENCNFELLLNNLKDRLDKEVHICYFEFLKYLKNLYFKTDYTTIDKKKLENCVKFSTYINNEKYAICLIHNKKSLPVRILDELYQNLNEIHFRKKTYDLTILILKEDEQNLHKFMKIMNQNFLKTYGIITDGIEIKIFYNQDLSSFPYGFLSIRKGLHFINKFTKKIRNNCNIKKNIDPYLYFERHLLYVFTISNTNKYSRFYSKMLSQNNFLNKRDCYFINIKINKKFQLVFNIFTKTNFVKFSENNTVLLKETVYIVYCEHNYFYELTKFSYYIKMNLISKENSYTNENNKKIKFNKKCEKKYFNQILNNEYQTVKSDDYLFLFNLISYKNEDYLNDDTKYLYYNDPILNQNTTTYDRQKNIVVLNVFNKKCDELNDGQNKINDFFLRLKNILKLCFFNTINSRNDYFVLDTNFKIDFNEKIIFKKFKTNISINDTEAIFKIKNNLEKIFKTCEISDVIYYDFKPLIYTEKYSFDSLVNLAFIDKQNQFDEIDILKEKKKFLSAKIYDSPNFYRFFYTIKKKINNEEIIYNAQFYYFENYFDVFRNWAANIDIKKIGFDKLKLCFDGEIKTELDTCIQEIFDKINLTLLFGLVLNKKYRLNIIKGICYNFFLTKDLILRRLVKDFSVSIYLKIDEKLKDFELAYITCNTRAIEYFEKDIKTNLRSLEKNFLSNKRLTEQDKKSSEKVIEKIAHINKFKLKHSILVRKIDKIFFIIFEEFKIYLISQEYNNYFCILTKINPTEIENFESDSQIENFLGEILTHF
ncbi:hypothetical protein GVAV_002262 [Gurleya vavrai]